MSKDVALYIGADPLTFNDISIIQKTIKTFGFVTVILDRKNRDAEYKEYFLNYADRLDIMKHDLRDLKVRDYRILPIDETVQKTLADNKIDTLVLNLDYQRATDFRMMTILQEVCPELTILPMHAPNYIERHFMKTIMDSDSTVRMYKKYCTDYSFFKFKLKTMKKVAITGNLGCNQELVMQAFKDRDFQTIDMDRDVSDLIMRADVADDFKAELRNHSPSYVDDVFPKGQKSFDKAKLIEICNDNKQVRSALEDIIFAYLQDIVAKKAVKTFDDYIIFNFSFLYELELESLFDTILCVHTPEVFQRDALAAKGFSDEYITDLLKFQNPIDDKMERSDFVFYGNKSADELKNNVIAFINSRMK